MPVLA
jgi:hypothetical protein